MTGFKTHFSDFGPEWRPQQEQHFSWGGWEGGGHKPRDQCRAHRLGLFPLSIRTSHQSEPSFPQPQGARWLVSVGRGQGLGFLVAAMAAWPQGRGLLRRIPTEAEACLSGHPGRQHHVLGSARSWNEAERGSNPGPATLWPWAAHGTF